MAAKSSLIRPMSWGGAFLTLVPLGLTLVSAHLLGQALGWTWNQGFLAGSTAYLFYRWIIVRRLVLADHRRGIIAMRAGRFEEGLAAFQASERAFDQRVLLDRYRALILGSASAHPFRILAQYNQAYALARLGQGEEALERLETVLSEIPSMTPAVELRDLLLAGSRLHPEVGAAMNDTPDQDSGER